MKILVTIIFSFFALISFLGVVAEKEPGFRKQFTVCFIVSALVILVANIIGVFA